MKATGIVRRIDDLGRVTIPKEIRCTYGIHEGDPLEIFTDNNMICFQKYDPAPTREQDAQHWLLANRIFLSRTCARFTIEGTTTVCECILNGRRVVGSAKCNPEDTFSPSVGMVYAFCRATNQRIPTDWM